jgi:hypothetical protein
VLSMCLCSAAAMELIVTVIAVTRFTGLIKTAAEHNNTVYCFHHQFRVLHTHGYVTDT